MTDASIFVAIWRKVTDLLKALDHADYDPLAEQQRRIAFLEERVARLESDHGGGCPPAAAQTGLSANVPTMR